MHPVTLFFSGAILEFSEVDLKQKLATFGHVLWRKLHQMVDLGEKLAPLSHSNQTVLLVMFGDIPINPLPMGDMQQLADEL
jgi:hypothetical protein